MGIYRRSSARSCRRRGARLIAPESVRIIRTESLESRQLLTTDSVLDWNAVLLDAVRTDRTAPPIAARAMAIVQTAVFDAVNSIDRTYTPFLVQVPVEPGASLDAAVAAAAHDTLVALFPGQAAVFDQRLATQLAAIPDGDAETSGLAVGHSVATQILALRSNDGSGTTVTYSPGSEPGDWQPTPPAFASPLLPHWGNVTLWTADSVDRFLPEAPPELHSRKYARDLEQVKQLGSVNSTTRTEDQTAIAQFWANGAGTSTPPGHWNVIAGLVAEQEGNTLVDNARMFALLDLALADAAIVCWNAKYDFDMWRPVTAIRNADSDGNARTDADPEWTPLLSTPPFPTYTSGHSTFSGAAAAVLKEFFGRDRISFTAPSENPAVEDRQYDSFSDAAEESGISRIYGGIHFNSDNVAGLQSGRKIGVHAARNFLTPVRPHVQAEVVSGNLVVRGTHRADQIRIRQSGTSLQVIANGRQTGTFDASLVTHILVTGGRGADHIVVTGVAIGAELHGDQGPDRIRGGTAADQLFGGSGHDLMFGGPEADTLNGNSGHNLIFGGDGDDQLHGIRGLDQLFGGSGDDQLFWL